MDHSAPAIPSVDGSLRFDDTNETVRPGMPVDEFQKLAIVARGHLHLFITPSFKSDSLRIFDAWFNVTMSFEDGRLIAVDLCPNRAADKAGWDGWTLENEMARKAFAESWAARVFGKPLQIKPIVIPGIPEPIVPASPKEQHPRHAVFPWGEVCSYYDSKGGFAGFWIRYGPPAPPSQI